MLRTSWRLEIVGPVLFLGVVISTFSVAKCLPGYESVCAELEAPVEDGGVGSQAGTGNISQRPPNMTVEQNSDFGIVQHGSEVWKRLPNGLNQLR